MDKKNPDKPFKTYEEQLDILKNKYQLKILDENFAIKGLKSLTYYDLINGYKDYFMKDNIFLSDITFEDIYLFALIDKHIQSILFEYSTIVENTYKSKLAYILSKNFGVFEDEYLNEKNYFKSNKGAYFYEIKKHCTDIYSSNRPIPQPTKHYKEHHNHIPSWILFKNVTFSNSIKLFRLLRKEEKREVSNLVLSTDSLSYGEKVDFIESGLNCIREFRNTIAHNLKFITYRCNKKNKLSPATIIKIFPGKIINWDDFKKFHRGINDIHAYLLALIVFLDDIALSYTLCLDLYYYLQMIHKRDEKMFLHYINISNLPLDIEIRLEYYINRVKQDKILVKRK